MGSSDQPFSVFDRDLGLGRRARLRRIFSGETALLLRMDQGLEAGPLAFVEAPQAADPLVPLRLAEEGGFSGVIAQIGLAEHYFGALAGRLPLILKLNGKTAIPPDDEALAPLNATVEDAVRLGADAVAYSLYAGTPAQFEDFTQFSHVRQECARFGMPLLALAEPRGMAVERKGGPSGLYVLEYAARIAAELGADLLALEGPVADPQRDAQAPRPYNTLHLTSQEALRRLVVAAGRTPLLLVSAGAGSADDVEAQASAALEAGAQGFVFGRSLWQRPQAEALEVATRVRRALQGAR